ncbi:MAG: HAMP domain-containing protein [Phycisphaerales bacterium]|nr:MAG: HAMP domain-containing protein [Phycisphaerales bacterium]
MRVDLRHIKRRLLKVKRIWPLSLARKVQATFGAAVILVLALALLIPYIWMGKLATKGLLNAGRSRSKVLLDRHFQLEGPGQTLRVLDDTGQPRDANDTEIRWIRFAEDDANLVAEFGKDVNDMVADIKDDEDLDDNVRVLKTEDGKETHYVRIFRATDHCIDCHNQQGTASPFILNKPVGAALIRSRDLARERGNTIFMNTVWIFVAGLIGGTGAIVAFYVITQRLILRPIRQLRALANNVAEGNLETRSAIATRDEYEKLARAFNHMLDVLQATQEKLRQANKQLDAKIAELSKRNIELFKANKIKSEFLANISHEFRTPLNAILGFAQVLREKPLGLRKAKAQRYAENIITSGNSLLNMINDLLDLAKARAGKMDLHIQQVSAADLLEALVSEFSLLADEKKIKVKLLVDSDLPLLVTDVGRVRQILYNFLSNALKFTPERGRIEIQAIFPAPGSGDTGPEGRMIRLAVTDNGCGIADTDKEKIFEKFRQADGSITRESTGSGLGLTISTELAAMLAGSIGLESPPPGRKTGAMFWLDIPITLTENDDRDRRED